MTQAVIVGLAHFMLRPPRMYVVLTYLILVTFNAVWWWRADAWLRMLPGRWGPTLRLAWAAFVALQLGTLSVVLLNYSSAYFTGASTSEWPIPRYLASLAYVWNLLVLPLVLLLWVIWVSVLSLASVARRVRSGQRTQRQQVGAYAIADTDTVNTSDVTPKSSRRVMLATLLTAPPTVAAAIAAASLPRLSSFRINSMTVTLPQLPAALDGLTIAHLSDTHVGYFTDEWFVRDIVDSVNALDADLVAITGDLVNRSLKDLPIAVEMIAALRSRQGLFVCEGNHDLIQDAARFRRESVEAGLPLLVNESATIDINRVPVQLLGLQWGSGDKASHPAMQRGDAAIKRSMRELLQQRDFRAFPILLAHHPHAFDFAADAGIPLTLAGHTHGGQMHVNDRCGFGPWIYRYWSGAYRRNDSVCIVSNGTGNWFPIRVNAPAEIIHLTLRRG